MKKTKKVFVAALALSMALAMNVTCAFAEEPLTTAKATVTSMKNADGTVTVSVSADGDLTMFDFGIVYDQSQMEVAKDAEGYEIADWDAAFSKFYSGAKYKGISIWQNMCDPAGTANGSSYIVLGGTSNDGAKYNGVIFSATFKLLGENASVIVVPDSASVKTNLSTSGKGLTLGAIKDTGSYTPFDPLDPSNPTTPPAATGAAAEAPEGDDNVGSVDTANGTAGEDTEKPADKKDEDSKAESADSGDSTNIVLPIVVICAAAAAVIVASKKKIKE